MRAACVIGCELLRTAKGRLQPEPVHNRGCARFREADQLNIAVLTQL